MGDQSIALFPQIHHWMEVVVAYISALSLIPLNEQY